MKNDAATVSAIHAAFGETCERYADLADSACLKGNASVYDAHTAFSSGYRSYHAGDKYPLGPSTDLMWFRQQGFNYANPNS
jgi:hypothetical protein